MDERASARILEAEVIEVVVDRQERTTSIASLPSSHPLASIANDSKSYAQLPSSLLSTSGAPFFFGPALFDVMMPPRDISGGGVVVYGCVAMEA